MIGSMYLDAQTLGPLAEGPEEELASALVGALAEEVYTVKRAVTTLIGVMEARYASIQDTLLQDLHEALRTEAQAPIGLKRSKERAEALRYLITAFEADLGSSSNHPVLSQGREPVRLRS